MQCSTVHSTRLRSNPGIPARREHIEKHGGQRGREIEIPRNLVVSLATSVFLANPVKCGATKKDKVHLHCTRFNARAAMHQMFPE